MTRLLATLLMLTAAALGGCGDDSGGSGTSAAGSGEDSSSKPEAGPDGGAPSVSAFRDGDGWRVSVAVSRPVRKIALLAGDGPAKIRTFEDVAVDGAATTWSAGFRVPAGAGSVEIVVTAADGTETQLTRALDD